MFDDRIDRKFQIGDGFYAGSGFDRGHVFRREDNYWGATDEEAVFSNFDTFHFTNCTPQHPAYNRSSKHGLWGELENHLADQALHRKPKLTILAGPVLSDGDIRRGDVLVPKQFWKVAAANRDEGGIAAFAFLLSQEQLVRDMEEDIEAGPFAIYQLSLRKLEGMTGLGFVGVLHEADTMRDAGEEAIRVPNLESLRMPSR